MAPSKIQKAIGAVKDQTSIGLAKVCGSIASDITVAIVKATRHNEHPAEERYIREILSLTCYCRKYINQCASVLCRRLSKTKSWAVALKSLFVVHRLLLEGDPAYEHEIFFVNRRGARMLLSLSHFRDTSARSAESWDYSSFVRAYARYLDEMLEFKLNLRKGRGRSGRSRSLQLHEEMIVMDEDERGFVVAKVQATPLREMKIETVVARAQQLQQLLDRFLACRPTGAAKNNRIVAIALVPLLKESYQLYADLLQVVGILGGRFTELEHPVCARIYEIFALLSKQFDDLERFYGWCKPAGISRHSEYPEIDKSLKERLCSMKDYIREQSDRPKGFQRLTSEEEEEEEEDAMRSEEPCEPAESVPAPPVEEEQEDSGVQHQHQGEAQAIIEVDVDEDDVDFLNLRAEAVVVQDEADRLALALFDTTASAAEPAAPMWGEITDDTADWETALVESASNLSGQRAALGGGFDMMFLDGMYNQQPQPASVSTMLASGSASSVANPMGSALMLALPAPPSANGYGADPFAASLAMPMPPYVQMPEIERKQMLMMQEQMLWQQYARDGMHGQPSIAWLQQQQQQQMHPMMMRGGYYQIF